MKTSADFVTEVCTVMLVPPVLMICIVLWAFIWIYLFLHVYAVGVINPVVSTNTLEKGKFYGEMTLT